MTKRHSRMERLYNRLNNLAIKAYDLGNDRKAKRIDQAMSWLGSIAFMEGCTAEWVG